MNKAFLLTILALAVLTWLTRALPFILLNRTKKKINFSQGRLQILGPALLLSTTMVVLTGELQDLTTNAVSLWPYLLSVAIVVLVTRWQRNIGLSVLMGLISYGLFLLL